MESMTGFAQGTLEEKDYFFSVQVKSVNARFLEQKIFSHKDLFEIENDFRSLIKSEILRGTVEAYIKFRRKEEAVDDTFKALLKKKSWVKSYQSTAKALGVEDDLSLGSLMKMAPLEEKKEFSKADIKKMKDLFKATLKDLKISREHEGKNLLKTLKVEIKELKSGLKDIEAWYKKNESVVRDEWQERVKLLKVEVDPDRLEQEISIVLEKSDIAEEIDRFAIHLKEFEKLLNSKKESVIGKKLDFYCQELTREANTIGSKSKKSDLTRLSVNLKSSVEKLRQQVQNIQ